MANSKIVNPNAVQTSTAGGMKWYKSGRVVYCVFDKNGVTAEADAKIADIPEGFEPIYGLSVLDTLHAGQYRIQFTGTTVRAITAMSGINIRGSVTYISAN